MLSASAKISLWENRSGLAPKLPNVGVAKLIWIVDNRGTRVHKSTAIRKSGYSAVKGRASFPGALQARVNPSREC